MSSDPESLAAQGVRGGSGVDRAIRRCSKPTRFAATSRPCLLEANAKTEARIERWQTSGPVWNRRGETQRVIFHELRAVPRCPAVQKCG